MYQRHSERRGASVEMHIPAAITCRSVGTRACPRTAPSVNTLPGSGDYVCDLAHIQLIVSVLCMQMRLRKMWPKVKSGLSNVERATIKSCASRRTLKFHLHRAYITRVKPSSPVLVLAHVSNKCVVVCSSRMIFRHIYLWLYN